MKTRHFMTVLRTTVLTSLLSMSLPAGLGFAQTPQPHMGEPVQGLTPNQLTLFLEGQVQYGRQFLAIEGLGPIFNDDSCGNCHAQPVLGGPGTQLVTRFAIADPFDPLADLGGSLLQDSAISPDCGEQVPVNADIVINRITTSSFGIGLIEAIPDADILALETNGGIAHMVPALEEPPGSPAHVGRFGWKAQLATVLSFSGDATLMEMGITNRLVGQENDPNGVNPPALLACDTVADPEDGPDGMGFDFIDRVTHFQRYLAAPPQTPKSGMTGETVFGTLGCASCHNPSFTTANTPGLESALRNKTIKPYSDFLLHDMGSLGDGIVQGMATGSLMRTPPLWGLRTRTNLLHDGRADNFQFDVRIDQAITAHDGDAAASRDAYIAASAADKAALVAFLDSLGRHEFDFGDGDNFINENDFFFGFKPAYGRTGVTPDDPDAIHDIDQDGDIDFGDFQAFLLVYNGVLGLDDCDGNGQLDLTDVLLGADCNNNLVPDSCDITNNPSIDLNANGVIDTCELAFVRGDCAGGDGMLELTDVIFELNYLFINGVIPACLDACDSDDNGAVQINDALYSLSFLFLSGSAPAAPFPGCGNDGTPANSIGCAVSDFCP